ncbi:hypothetical protein FA13DRAFT_1720715 [Coprinellus micaceus]|uniref:Uncharacterized protein n=1 Tax=Coprinellus micaceus TaxID=71717 RepID=A0A4Y7S6U2_COPMI|nr:hypothetical protein FA13DRAFT_1720715 [Coprinellus micaceus]
MSSSWAHLRATYIGFYGFGIQKGTTRSTTYKPLDNRLEEYCGLLEPSAQEAPQYLFRQVPAAFACQEGALAALLGGLFIDYINTTAMEFNTVNTSTTQVDRGLTRVKKHVKMRPESTLEAQGIIFDDFQGAFIVPLGPGVLSAAQKWSLCIYGTIYDVYMPPQGTQQPSPSLPADLSHDFPGTTQPGSHSTASAELCTWIPNDPPSWLSWAELG